MLSITGPRARRAAFVIAPLSLLAVAAPTIALATPDNVGTTYTGCLDSSGLNAGALFAVKAGANPVYPCPHGSTKISWNAKGVQGETGAQGGQGNQGSEGAQGPKGEQGPDGAQGPEGPQGPQGPQGNDGVQGPEGPEGAEGPQGPEGPQGDQGETGAQGEDGRSAYEVAVEDGNFEGTVEEWLESLQGNVVAGEGEPGTPGKDGVDGKDGKDGKDGVNGKNGVNGKDGVSGYQRVSAKKTVGAGKDATVTVNCESGRALGGGSWASNEDIDQRSSAPTGNGKGWRVSMTNLGTKSYDVTAYAICAQV